MNNDYFVRIAQPSTNRVLLLESSALLVEALQGYHKVQLIRKKKLKTIDVMKSQVKEVMMLLNRFESLMPKEHLPDSFEPLNDAKEEITTDGEIPVSSMTQNKIEQLDKTLETIKRRLEDMQ